MNIQVFRMNLDLISFSSSNYTKAEMLNFFIRSYETYFSRFIQLNKLNTCAIKEKRRLEKLSLTFFANEHNSTIGCSFIHLPNTNDMVCSIAVPTITLGKW